MPIDAEAPPSPVTRHGQLEVDAFCAGCGYNLHGQIVSLDERLGFPVCRCPECGRYHPAGDGVTSRYLWLHRFAATLLAIWVIVVLLVCFLLTLAMGGLQNGSVEEFTYTHTLSPDNRPVTQGPLPNGGGFGYTITGTSTVVLQPHFVRTTEPPPEMNPQFLSTNRDLAIMIFVSVLLGFLLSTLLVTFLWHWPRWRYISAIALPVIAAGLVLCAFFYDQQYDTIHGWIVGRVLMMVAVQSAGILLGILLGRKLSRTIVRMVVPPKPRQMLAFLWLADGKPLPSSMMRKA
jgi:Mg2+/citrate symporter